MNIERFTKHIASRKVEPIDIELKKSHIEIPPDYTQASVNVVKNKARGCCSLQEATIVSCQMNGDRQWVRLSFNNDFKDEGFLTWLNDTTNTIVRYMGKDTDTDTDTLMLSRYQRDYTGKTRVPLRLWKRDGGLQPYEGALTVGTIVVCSFSELRAYCRKDGAIKVAADLHRDIVVVRKSNKRRRVLQYFSDGE